MPAGPQRSMWRVAHSSSCRRAAQQVRHPAHAAGELAASALSEASCLALTVRGSQLKFGTAVACALHLLDIDALVLSICRKDRRALSLKALKQTGSDELAARRGMSGSVVLDDRKNSPDLPGTLRNMFTVSTLWQCAYGIFADHDCLARWYTYAAHTFLAVMIVCGSQNQCLSEVLNRATHRLHGAPQSLVRPRAAGSIHGAASLRGSSTDATRAPSA
jgi:hypothetical protein